MASLMRSLNDISLISFVSPAHNEANSLSPFLSELIDSIEKLNLPCAYEIVVVDDGSMDDTPDILASWVESYPDVMRVVRLTRNFGFCAASTAALYYSKGDIVILMDADMQDDPAIFPSFLEKWIEGYDVVYAVRMKRQESTIVKALTWIFYRMLRLTSPISLPLDAGTYALMDRKVVNAIEKLPERNRYIPGLRSWSGYRQIGIPVQRRQRIHGRSRMGLRKLFDLAMMAFFTFSYTPLFFFRLLAICGLGIAFLLILACPAFLFLGHMNWQSVLMLLMVAFFSSVNLLGIVLLSEYVALVYDEVRNRPLYLVDRIIENQSLEHR